jgi:hypothetical protein
MVGNEMPDPEQHRTGGQRRRRRRQHGVGLTILALAGLAAVGLGCLDRPESDHGVTADGESGTDQDDDPGVTVQYPPTWRRAPTALTPDLSDPVEILSLGTADLPVGGTCAQFPVSALEAMGTTDAFLTVQERQSDDASFGSRPRRLPPSGSKNNSEVVDCLAEPATFDHWWFAFQDAGRSFHVLVALGTQASEQTRAELWAILDSLQFDSR